MCLFSEGVAMNYLHSHTMLTRAGVTIAVVALMVACSKPPAPEEPIRAVKVLTVGAQAMQSRLEYAGEVRPRLNRGWHFGSMAS